MMYKLAIAALVCATSVAALKTNAGNSIANATGGILEATDGSTPAVTGDEAAAAAATTLAPVTVTVSVSSITYATEALASAALQEEAENGPFTANDTVKNYSMRFTPASCGASSEDLHAGSASDDFKEWSGLVADAKGGFWAYYVDAHGETVDNAKSGRFVNADQMNQVINQKVSWARKSACSSEKFYTPKLIDAKNGQAIQFRVLLTTPKTEVTVSDKTQPAKDEDDSDEGTTAAEQQKKAVAEKQKKATTEKQKKAAADKKAADKLAADANTVAQD
jgi:hypothetical protein